MCFEPGAFQSTIEEFAIASNRRPKLQDEISRLRFEKEQMAQKIASLEQHLADAENRCKDIMGDSHRVTANIEMKYKNLQDEFAKAKVEFENQIRFLKSEKDKERQKHSDEASSIQREMDLMRDKNGRLNKDNSQLQLELVKSARIRNLKSETRVDG